MPSVDDLFTPVDELRLTEPSYLRNSPDIGLNEATTAFSQKTPVMALDEGSRRVFGVPPTYQMVGEVSNFGISCHLMGITVEGHAKAKKVAKHLAARAMLHKLIEKGQQSEFGIPGETKEEAHRAVDGLAFGDVRIESSNEDPVLSVAQNENYPGKLQQLCQRNKFEIPQYSYGEEGPPNDRIFTTTCKVGGQEAVGVAKTKKASKNIASQKMLAIIEKGIVEMNEEPDLDQEVDDDMNPVVDGVQCSKPPGSDAMAVLTAILADPKRFESPTQEYRILEKKCVFGLTQCLLKISYCKPGEPSQSRVHHVFPGFSYN